jgi:Cytochrome c oxidase subunit VII
MMESDNGGRCVKTICWTRNKPITNSLASYIQTSRSSFLLYPFYTMMFSSLFFSTYGMCRMVFVSTASPQRLQARGTDHLVAGTQDLVVLATRKAKVKKQSRYL